jgi:hypothetical protein
MVRTMVLVSQDMVNTGSMLRIDLTRNDVGEALTLIVLIGGPGILPDLNLIQYSMGHLRNQSLFL